MVLLDIFSKNKVMEKKKKIIVDNREGNSLVPSELKKLGFEIEFKQLSLADYVLGDTAIERKTISDFISSIIDKRIFSQLEGIKQYPNYFLIVEGDLNEIYSGVIHENALRGMILSSLLDYKVSIIFTVNEKDTAGYIDVLSRRSGKLSSSLRVSKIALTNSEQVQFILEGFPNIGPVNAKKLIAEFKNLKNIANASLSDLEKVIGKRAEKLYSLLNSLI